MATRSKATTVVDETVTDGVVLETEPATTEEAPAAPEATTDAAAESLRTEDVPSAPVPPSAPPAPGVPPS